MGVRYQTAIFTIVAYAICSTIFKHFQWIEQHDFLTSNHDDGSNTLFLSEKADASPLILSPREKKHKNEQTQKESNYPTNKNGKFIRYKLVRGLSYNYTNDPCPYFCLNESDRARLPILEQEGVADFHLEMETNLNIVYIGDSVGVQFVQSLQEAAGALKHSKDVYQVIRYGFWRHKVSHVARVRGGGIIGGIRITGWFKNSTMNVVDDIMPNGGGGWMESDVREMKRLVHQWHGVKTLDRKEESQSPCEIKLSFGSSSNTSKSIGKEVHKDDYNCIEQDFDISVHQFAAGWIHGKIKPQVAPFLEKFTTEAIDETIKTTIDRFGTRVIIVQTIPIMNNIQNIQELVVANQRIWAHVKTMREQSIKDKQPLKMLVMELGALSTSLVLYNAIHIGELAADSDSAMELMQLHSESILEKNFHFHNPTFARAVTKTLDAPLLHRLNSQSLWSKIVSHACGAFVNETYAKEIRNCPVKNVFSYDGQHWCMDSIGGRIDAALVCLLDCSNKYDFHQLDELVQCESDCNAKFMSLSPVNWNNV
mmetsp:Transcript_16561/g.31384  ORF Transcript_16561/g.31384 Transcript_16561/m.31384 type:complete len:537 (+) Transcript_16561:242-1852(+)